jgi:hypothetical protein
VVKMLVSLRIPRKMDKLTSYNVTETFDGRLVGGVYLLHIKMVSGLFRPSSLRAFLRIPHQSGHPFHGKLDSNL